MRLLAIDDLADNLVSLSALLRTYLPGCEMETALSGEEGIAKARSFQPDTILLDIQMPGMDGFDVCRALKEDASTRDIPVIFLTAQNTDPASHIRGLEIGGDAFLAKPVNPGELTAQVKAMVRIKLIEDRLRGERHALEELVAERTAALESSENRLRFALEGANDGLWDVQMKTGEVYLSPRGCEILGYTLEELPQSAQLWTHLVHPDDMPRTRERLTANLEGHAPLFRVELRFRMKSGEWKWVLPRAKVVTRDAQGNALRIAGTITDISERKWTEEELREQLDELRRWHEATLGREMRVLELKREVNELLAEAGRPRRYVSAEADRGPEASAG